MGRSFGTVHSFAMSGTIAPSPSAAGVTTGVASVVDTAVGIGRRRASDGAADLRDFSPARKDLLYRCAKSGRSWQAILVNFLLLHLILQDPRFVVNEAVVTSINEGGYP